MKKDIPGYENYYYATIDGEIHSHDRVVKFGKKDRIIKSKKKILSNHCQGYLRIVLTKNKEHRFYLVHRLIALTFIPNPENKPFVNHIDGNKENNHVFNLEWVTRNENELHAISIGKKPKGEKNGSAKISNEDAEYIRNNYVKRNNAKLLAEKFGITRSQVQRIANNKSRVTFCGE